MQPRSAQRFPFEEPVFARWSKGGVQQVTGMTRDVSIAGVFFYADSAPFEGSLIEVVLTLPPEVTGSRKEKQLLCRGRVVRVEQPEENRYGIAMQTYEMLGD